MADNDASLTPTHPTTVKTDSPNLVNKAKPIDSTDGSKAPVATPQPETGAQYNTGMPPVKNTDNTTDDIHFTPNERKENRRMQNEFYKSQSNNPTEGPSGSHYTPSQIMGQPETGGNVVVPPKAQNSQRTQDLIDETKIIKNRGKLNAVLPKTTVGQQETTVGQPTNKIYNPITGQYKEVPNPNYLPPTTGGKPQLEAPIKKGIITGKTPGGATYSVDTNTPAFARPEGTLGIATGTDSEGKKHIRDTRILGPNGLNNLFNPKKEAERKFAPIGQNTVTGSVDQERLKERYDYLIGKGFSEQDAKNIVYGQHNNGQYSPLSPDPNAPKNITKTPTEIYQERNKQQTINKGIDILNNASWGIINIPKVEVTQRPNEHVIDKQKDKQEVNDILQKHPNISRSRAEAIVGQYNDERKQGLRSIYTQSLEQVAASGVMPNGMPANPISMANMFFQQHNEQMMNAKGRLTPQQNEQEAYGAALAFNPELIGLNKSDFEPLINQIKNHNISASAGYRQLQVAAQQKAREETAMREIKARGTQEQQQDKQRQEFQDQENTRKEQETEVKNRQEYLGKEIDRLSDRRIKIESSKAFESNPDLYKDELKNIETESNEYKKEMKIIHEVTKPQWLKDIEQKNRENEFTIIYNKLKSGDSYTDLNGKIRTKK